IGPDASGSFNAGESTIALTVTDIHGNVSTASTVVIVNTTLTVTIPDVYAMNPAVDLKNTIYLGYGPSSFTVNANANGGAGSSYTYEWSTGATTASIQVSAAGNYTVMVTDQKGCEQTASITIQILDVQCGNNNDKVMICHNDKTICIASADVQDHLNHGDYLGTCNATASRSANTNTAVASVESVKEGTIVYPNPVANRLTIKVDRLQEGALVKVYNANGAVVASARLTNATQNLSVQTLAAGIYYVQVINGGVITTKKIIKQ
ncbi:MAG TPA: T9SS type A sorting domain-containing protein, partial [Chitinophagaceae bacterium]|nr:T9SS type A sorting domain-containing protein [Chitinophagaceae bacterium]